LSKVILEQAASPPLPRTIPNRSFHAPNFLTAIRRKLPIGYNRAPRVRPQNYSLYRGPIPKPNFLPHPWTHPTYHPKPHLYPISHFATMHRTVDRQTHTQTNRWLKGMFDMTIYKAREPQPDKK